MDKARVFGLTCLGYLPFFSNRRTTLGAPFSSLVSRQALLSPGADMSILWGMEAVGDMGG